MREAEKAEKIAERTLALFAYGDDVYAVDNRCPHMGFPLDRGTVKDGILTLPETPGASTRMRADARQQFEDA